MSKPKKVWTYRLLQKLSYVIAALLMIHIVIQTINFVTWPTMPTFLEFSNRVDVDDEASIPTWYSQFILIIASIFAFIAARLAMSKQQRRVWYLLSLATVLISLDEVARLHEFVIQTIHVKLWGTEGSSITKNAWLIILPFIVAGGLTLLIAIYRALPRRTFKLMLLGGVVYFSGAIGIEILSSGMNPNSWTYTTLVTAFEEGLEMMGSALLVFAAADYIDRTHKSETKLLLQMLNVPHKK